MASNPYAFADGRRVLPRDVRRPTTSTLLSRASGSGGDSPSAESTAQSESTTSAEVSAPCRARGATCGKAPATLCASATWTSAVLANAERDAAPVTIRVNNHPVRVHVRVARVEQMETDRHAAGDDVEAAGRFVRACSALVFTPACVVPEDAPVARAGVPLELAHQPYVVPDRGSASAQRLDVSRSLASTLNIISNNEARRLVRGRARAERASARGKRPASAASPPFEADAKVARAAADVEGAVFAPPLAPALSTDLVAAAAAARLGALRPLALAAWAQAPQQASAFGGLAPPPVALAKRLGASPDGVFWGHPPAVALLAGDVR